MSETQGSLFGSPDAYGQAQAKSFGGDTFVPEFDLARLNAQLRRVYDVLARGEWVTLREIATATEDPEASISARIRDLRKKEFGGFIVDGRRRGDAKRGLWEYRLNKGA